MTLEVVDGDHVGWILSVGSAVWNLKFGGSVINLLYMGQNAIYTEFQAAPKFFEKLFLWLTHHFPSISQQRLGVKSNSEAFRVDREIFVTGIELLMPSRDDKDRHVEQKVVEFPEAARPAQVETQDYRFMG